MNGATCVNAYKTKFKNIDFSLSCDKNTLYIGMTSEQPLARTKNNVYTTYSSSNSAVKAHYDQCINSRELIPAE